VISFDIVLAEIGGFLGFVLLMMQMAIGSYQNFRYENSLLESLYMKEIDKRSILDEKDDHK